MNNHHETLTKKESNLVEVTSKDVPLSCPMPGTDVWSSHPRVFLPITDTGSAICPYCGTHYVMTDWHEGSGHHH
jgi:uncharacterized Zn-finger protein